MVILVINVHSKICTVQLGNNVTLMLETENVVQYYVGWCNRHIFLNFNNLSSFEGSPFPRNFKYFK